MRLFSSDKHDIPWLRTDRQAAAINAPVRAWGSVARGKAYAGTWHFYTDDTRFAALWNRERWTDIPDSGAVCAVEINYSAFDDTPEAVFIERLWRKRYIAREWQEAGLHLLVDLNVPERFSALNLLGVPLGWSAFATRGYATRVDSLEREHELANRHCGCAESFLFVVFGGGKKAADFCAANRGCIHFATPGLIGAK